MNQECSDTLTQGHAIGALGWLSAELASRAGAWDGNAPHWFPQPPEWLELWDRAVAATREEYEAQTDAFHAALRAGDDAHLLTIGSPTRGLALRVTLGRLSRHGRWYGWQPSPFLIWRGKVWEPWT